MAIVPVAQPTVENRPTAPVYANPAAANGAFGADLGAATAQFGQVTEKLGETGMAIAARLNYTNNALKPATDGANQLDQFSTDALFGDNGYLKTKGDASVSGRTIALENWKKARDQIAGGLTDPRARELFDAHANSASRTFQTTVSRHALEQGVAAMDQTLAARTRIAGQDMFNYQNNPAVIDQKIATMRGVAEEQGRLHGQSPETVEMEFRKSVSASLVPLIQEQALTNAGQAQAMLARYRNTMLPSQVVGLEEHIKPKLIAQEATAAIAVDMAKATGGDPTTHFDRNVIRAESNGYQIDPKTGKVLTSSAGALGVAQIKPGTAKETADKNGIPFDSGKLSNDKEYNANLGRLYHAEQMKKYDGNLVLADAAYNAGPARVDEWIKANGDPRTGAISAAEWAAKIPIKETRDYVTTGTGAVGAMMGRQVYPDWAAMQQAILTRTAGNPDMQAAQLSRLGVARQLFNDNIRQDQVRVNRLFNDTKTALESGRDDVTIPEAEIFRVMPAVEAADMVAQLKESQDFGQAGKVLAWATPAEVAATRAALATGQGDLPLLPRLNGKNVTAPQGGGGSGDLETAALRARHLARFDALIARRQASLAADPKGYADASPVVQKYALSGDLEAYLTSNRAEQLRLGVGVYDVRSLTPQKTKELVETLHNLDPATADVGAELDKMAKSYGKQWPNVMDDLVRRGKLNPAYQVLADMNLPAQAGARADLQRALKLEAGSPGKLAQSLSPDTKKNLPGYVSDALAEFRASTRVGGAELYTTVVDPAVYTLAQYYAAGGMTAKAAAKMAVDNVINSKYEFDDHLRVPKGPNGESRLAAVTASAAGVQERLTAADLAIPPARPNEFRTPLERQGVALKAAQQGVWSAGPDGNSAVLNAVGQDGLYYTVIGSNGQPVAISFDNLPAPGTPSRGVGTDPMGTPVMRHRDAWHDPAKEVPGQIGNITKEHIDLAREVDAFYGTGLEAWTQENKNSLDGENYTAALLTARRSPLAALGFDPRRYLEEKKTGGPNVLGDYNMNTDQLRTWHPVSSEKFQPDVMAHEFTHRSIKMLADRFPEDRLVKAANYDLDGQEIITRLIEHKIAGTEPTASDIRVYPELDPKNKDHARLQRIVKHLEDLAAKMIAERRPGGPR